MSVKSSSSIAMGSVIPALGSSVVLSVAGGFLGNLYYGSAIPFVAAGALTCLAPIAMSQFSRHMSTHAPEFFVEPGRLIDRTGDRVIEAVRGILPATSKTEPLPAPRTQIISSETESLYLFKGTERLKLEEKEVTALRVRFIIIEEQIRSSDPFLKKDWDALLKLDTALFDAKQAGNPTDAITTEIEKLEKRLKVTLSIDFYTGQVWYTNGDGEKIEVDLSKDKTGTEAQKGLIEIYETAVTRHAMTRAASSVLTQLKEDSTIENKEQIVKVDLIQGKYYVKGEKEGIDIPDVHKYTAPIEEDVKAKKDIFSQVILSHQSDHSHILHRSRRGVESWALQLSKRLDTKKRGWIPFRSTPLGKASQEIEYAEASSLHSEYGENTIEIKKLKIKLAFLEALRKKVSSVVLRADLKLDEIEVDSIKGTGFENQMDISDHLSLFKEELIKVDLHRIETALRDQDPSRLKIKKRIIGALKTKLGLVGSKEGFLAPNNSAYRPGYDETLVALHDLTVEDLKENIDQAVFDECKTEILDKEINTVNLDRVRAKWHQRKIQLEGKEGAILKAQEKFEYAKVRIRSKDSIAQKDWEQMQKIHTTRDLLNRDPLARTILSLYQASESKDLGKIFAEVEKEAKIASSKALTPEQTQYLLNVFALLVTPANEEAYFQLVKSKSTLFHSYSAQNEIFGLGPDLIAGA